MKLCSSIAFGNFHIFAQAEKGTDHKIRMGQWTTSSSTTLTTRCVLKQCTSFSKPCQGNTLRCPCQATIAQRFCVPLLYHRGANSARDVSDMARE